MSGNSLDWQRDAPAMAELFRESEDTQQPRPGDLRRGVVVTASADGIVVDIRSKQQGWIPRADLEKIPPAERRSLQVGQELLVYVTDAEVEAGRVQLSLYLARKEQDWLLAEDLRQRNAFWEGRVSGYNKGGLVVPFGHIRGFVPASQVSGITRDLSGEGKLARLAEFVGQELAFKVVDVDRRQRRLILSERLGRTAQRARKQEEVLTELRKGETVRGRVRALTEYGAFVDLGGMVGLIHRTELAWFRVEHPVEIVQEGQEVEAHVLRVNRERGRVSLSLKRTHPDPWATVMEHYQLDQLVEGRVIRQTGAGLFVLLDDGVLGFVSQSDFRQSERAQENLAIGQRALARVVRIDGARRRLGLSLRRVSDAEWQEWHSRTAGQPPAEVSAGPAPESVPEIALAAGPEVGGEAVPKVGSAAGPEASPEAPPEVGGEAVPEVGSAAGPQVSPEASPEVGGEAVPEVGSAAGPEVSPEAPPEVTPEATPEVSPAACPEAASEDRPGVSQELGPEAGTAAPASET